MNPAQPPNFPQGFGANLPPALGQALGYGQSAYQALSPMMQGCNLFPQSQPQPQPQPPSQPEEGGGEGLDVLKLVETVGKVLSFIL